MMLKMFLFSLLALGAREEKSHVHGAAQMSLAFDGKNGKLEMELPSMGVFGFEHAATSVQDINLQKQGLKKLNDKISEMFVFEPSLKCVFKKDSIHIHQSGSHSDVEAQFLIHCDKPPVGTKIVANVVNVFPDIKTIQLKLLSENVQKQIEIKKTGVEFEFK